MKFILIQAKASEVVDDLIQAAMTMPIAAPNEQGQSEIQWMPPGEHEINASVNGKTGKAKPKSTPATAALVDAQIKAMLAKGDEPYVDFEHADGEASGWPVSARWGGDDPETGGVRLTVNWSDSGLAAIKGKRFKRFSPTFHLAKDGTVSGVELNLGGLVNRPAFPRIQKVSAKKSSTEGGASEDENNPAAGVTPIMKELLKVLAKQKLISSCDLSETEAVVELSGRTAEITEGLQVRAKLTTDYVAKSEYDALKAKHDASLKTNAELVVAKAVADGKIAPKDDKVQAKFVSLLIADPTNVELLDAMPVTVKVPDRVVKAKAGDRLEEPSLTGTDGFPALVKAKAKEKSISEDDAMLVVAQENPKAYSAYCDALGSKAVA